MKVRSQLHPNDESHSQPALVMNATFRHDLTINQSSRCKESSACVTCVKGFTCFHCRVRKGYLNTYESVSHLRTPAPNLAYLFTLKRLLHRKVVNLFHRSHYYHYFLKTKPTWGHTNSPHHQTQLWFPNCWVWNHATQLGSVVFSRFFTVWSHSCGCLFPHSSRKKTLPTTQGKPTIRWV